MKSFFFEAYTCWSVYRCFAVLQVTSIVRVQDTSQGLVGCERLGGIWSASSSVSVFFFDPISRASYIYLSLGRYAISVVSSVAYGQRVRDMNQKIVKENQEIDHCECEHVRFCYQMYSFILQILSSQ